MSSDRSKPKARSSRDEGERVQSRPRATVNTSESRVKAKGHEESTKKPAGGDAKARESRRDVKGTGKSVSSSDRRAGKSNDRASRDSGRIAIAAAPKATASASKGKGPALRNRGKKNVHASGGAMPPIQAFSGTTDALGKFLLHNQNDAPVVGGGSGGNNDDKRSRDDKKSDKGKRGGGPPGGRGDDGGDPGGNLPGGGSKTIQNVNRGACILSNSGLPTELRQKIYSYMLDHRIVKYDPNNPPPRPHKSRMPHSRDYFGYYGRAPAYGFTRELFHYTNRETRKDAKTYFNAQNKLILVSFCMPDFKCLLHYHSVPIITDSEALEAYCDIHAAHLKIEWPISAMHQDQDGDAQEPRENPERGAFLMILEDFPKLCSMMKYICQHFMPPAVYVCSGRDDPLDIQAVTNNNTPMLELNVTRPKVLMHRRKDLAAQLEQIVGGGHGLVITSADPYDPIATPEFVRSLKSSLAPPLIWLHALETDRVKATKEVRADAFNLDGNYDDGLYYRYYKIFEYFAVKRRQNLNRWLEFSSTRLNDDLLAAVRAGRSLEVYIQLEFAAMLLRVQPEDHDVSGLVRNILGKQDTSPELAEWPVKMKLLLRHIHLLAILADNQHHVVGEVSEILRYLTQNMHALPHHYPQAQHDLATLAPPLDEANGNRPNPSVEDVFEQMSLFEPGCWGFELPNMWAHEPIEGLKFWQDEIALSRLTDVDKAAILALQKDNGLRLSEF